MSEQNKKKRIALWILFGLCLALFAAAGIQLVVHLCPADIPQPTTPPTTAPTTQGTQPTDPPLPDNPKDFVAEAEKYPDIVGWIKIPGTVIDYPIMRSSENPEAATYEENYYLTRRPDGSKHKEGSIYMQKINQADFSDPNTVLYGHNMASGRMFAAIHKFKKRDFFNENRYIYVYAPGKVLTYEIYSLFVFDDRHILNTFNFFDQKDYSTFLNHTLNPASMTRQVREGVDVTTENYILTLSTCTNRDEERLLLIGVLTDVQFTK